MVRSPALLTLETVVEQLEGRAFEGFYVERRLTGTASPIGNHRPHYSAAVLLPPDEGDLIRELSNLDEQFKLNSPATLSSYEAGPPPCMLARIDDTALGCYWFQIVSVSLEHDQVIYDLHRLRYLPNKSFPSAASTDSSKPRIDIQDFQLKINPETITNALKFVLVVIAASIVGSFKVVEFLGNFILKFMREVSIFMEKSTPMFMAFLHFMSRCASASFAFFTMMVRGNKPIRIQNFPPIDYDRRNSYRNNPNRYS